MRRKLRRENGDARASQNATQQEKDDEYDEQNDQPAADERATVEAAQKLLMPHGLLLHFERAARNLSILGEVLALSVANFGQQFYDFVMFSHVAFRVSRPR